MSRSSDAGHFFQTSDSLATSARKTAKAKNRHGDPIKLPSKLLAVLADPNDEAGNVVYVAEAAGEVKKVKLDTSEVTRTSNRGTAPLTSLAICPKSRTLFSGCWDKSIYATSLDTHHPLKKLTGHTDFVKCLLATSLNSHPILISGGADSTLIIWDLETYQPLHKLQLPTPKPALQDLAIDPLSLPDHSADPGDSFVLFTASSDREIKRWHISRDAAYELPESFEHPIRAHETSVYKLCFDSDGDLWTASADKTARHLVRSRGWEADEVLSHPDFVRDVVVVEPAGVLVTACRDEGVRVWGLGGGELVGVLEGHWEEVTGLAVVAGGKEVASVSIDGTVRRWSVEKGEVGRFLEEVRKEAEGEGVDKSEQEKKGSVMTAEEEAELAELMDDDD